MRSLLIAVISLLVAGCSSPGGRTIWAPGADADTADAVLFPDVPITDTATQDTAPEVDTVPEEDTYEPVDTAPELDTWTPPDTVVEDTTPEDTAPEEDTVPPQDTFTPFCKNGDPCNDDDPCTVNDRCVDNHCSGDPITCDDDVPCTTDACVEGQCVSTPLEDYCLIGGVCWNEAQKNPNNGCQACVSGALATGWTNTEGVSCDDGDPCTEGEACAAGACTGGVTPEEICDDTLDNDCNGQTDAEDVACGAAEPCAYHEDCYPERVCARWATTGQAVCSEPCIGDSDCLTGQICSKLPGAAQVGFCQDPVPGLLVNGASCADDSQCSSGLCVIQDENSNAAYCRALCLSETRCSEPGYTCRAIGDLSVGFIAGACTPNPVGTLSNGQLCGSGNSALCASGQCDLMPPSGPWPCRPLCHSETECDPPMECNVVLYSPTENANAMPFATFYTLLSHDAVTACYTPANTNGYLQDGSPCIPEQHWQCQSNKCYKLIPGDDQAYCTSYCEFDVECIAGMICKLDLVTLANDWLQSPWFEHQPYSLNRTLVRVCKWE